MSAQPVLIRMPQTVPFWRSKRVLMFGLMIIARVVPVVWHNPAVKDICDWLLNLSGAGAMAFVAKDSGKRITLNDERQV